TITFKMMDKEYFLYKKGILSEKLDEDKIFKPNNEDIRQTIETMSDYSIYAFEQEIKNGFITLKGGFRVGITGTAIIEQEKIKAIKNISSINIRIARQILGCSKKILPYIKEEKYLSTIIISPPNCGKTTLLRDIIKEISDFGENVAVIDERSEIAGIYMGISQMDLGIRTDIFDRCPKEEGMINALRSMSPNFIAIDEIGTNKDINALEKVFNSGVKVICTIHAENIEELKQKYGFSKILENRYFKRYIVIKKEDLKFKVEGVYNEKLEKIYKGGIL
ncbi:MAG: stage III sporulation protein AA, partial [Eubacteriales bacterium]|nr:stage III sporulation protein AA [Eubacteriales bacterium]